MSLDLITSLLDAFDVLNAVFLLTMVLLMSCILLQWRRAGKLPPGPTGIPFLGYGPFIDKSMSLWRMSRELANRYNSDITSLNIFGRTAVFLTSREAVKEALEKRHDLAERPKSNFFKTLDPTHNGLLMSSGDSWTEHRQFCLRMIRDFGSGKNTTEENIQDEAVNLCRNFQNFGKETAFDPLKLLEFGVSNIICAIGFGKRFPLDDPTFNSAIEALNFLVGPTIITYGRLRVSKMFHRLAPYIYPKLKRATQEKYDIVCEFIRGIIDEHKKVFNGSVNDLMDGFLLEQSKRTETAKRFFSDQQLRHIIFDLFLTGSEKVTTTLRWALLYLIKYPDIQERIYREISSIIGTERVPNMSDRNNTPFTEAFLLEIQRFNTVVPISIPHSCSQDVYFMGYLIPANSVIFANLASIHRDPRDFQDADTFLPEHFFDGDKVINAEKVNQFGIGRRACLGEALARMEIYIFFTTMVQRLKFVKSQHQEINLNCPTHSGIQSPEPFVLHAISRQSTKLH